MRLDQALVERGLAHSRSRASDLIRQGMVELNNNIVQKPHQQTTVNDEITVTQKHQYVSRAAYKLASVSGTFSLDFVGKTVLDIGSSTGGFTDYALQHGAAKVIAVDVGTDQLHHKLRLDKRVDVHEKTDIRDFSTQLEVDIVTIDVSFISILDIVPAALRFCGPKTTVVAMVKPQFETGKKHKGVVKNDTVRRQTLADVEQALKQNFKILNKKDSELSGTKGNVERFYLLKAWQSTKH